MKIPEPAHVTDKSDEGILYIVLLLHKNRKIGTDVLCGLTIFNMF